MHEIEYLTIRSGWLILMSHTKKGVCILLMRFLLSDSLPNEDEPDETDIPIYIHNHLLRERELQKDIKGRELVL